LGLLDRPFASVCAPGLGPPGLPTRLVARLFILKHMQNLSDEVLCACWLENPYYQFFCGELSFCHRLPFDRSSLTHWRQRLGAEQLVALIHESLSVAHKPERWRPGISNGLWSTPRCSPKRSRIRPMCGSVIAHWKNWSISRSAITCRYGRAIGASPSAPLSWSGRYTHAHQFTSARRELEFLRIRLGRVIRGILRWIGRQRHPRGTLCRLVRPGGADAVPASPAA